MPKYEDLSFLREKLFSIGREEEILKSKNETPNLSVTPEKKEIIKEDDSFNTDDLLKDISEDFSEGHIISEDDNLDLGKVEESTDFLNSISFDDFTKEEDVLESEPLEDNLLESYKPDNKRKLSTEENNWDELKDDSFSALDSISFDDNNEKSEDGIDEMSALLEDINLDNTVSTDKEEPFDLDNLSLDNTASISKEEPFDLDNLSFDNMASTDKEESFDLDNLSLDNTASTDKEEPFDLDNLSLDNTASTSKEESFDLDNLSLDNTASTNKEESFDLDNLTLESSTGGNEVGSELENLSLTANESNDSDLFNLMGEIKSDDSELSMKITDNLEVNEDSSLSPLSDDLVDLAGDFAETEITSEEKPKDINDTLADIVSQDKKDEVHEEDNFDLSSLDDFSVTEEKKNESEAEEPSDILPSLEEELPEISGEEIPDVDLSEEKENLGNEDFDFSSLDNFTVDTSSLPDESEKFEEDKTYEIPKESAISEKKAVDTKKISTELNDSERKQIVITLSALPKDVKKKIIEAIISNKYSDAVLRPLIDVLIENDKPQTIIKAYEKITNDTSLSKIPISKYTGAGFEEQKKSFAYVFQKNILPIISRIAAVSLLLFILIFTYVSFIYPTMEAGKYYNLGKKNIKEKKFWDVEPYFEKAYEIQPRYNEVVEYARLYRENKRYLESEKKYYFALNMKPNEPLKLEFADFFREIKDYERAIKFYEEMLRDNSKNVKAILGLANTYLDFSEESFSQIENAKEEYLNVLALDGKNFDATFALLEINLRQKNHNEIMKHYRYIEKNFKKRVDPTVYANLAEYLLNVGDVDEIRNILLKASKSTNGKMFPEIDYLFARYKKFLNINNEEKDHLENALKRFEIMKQTDLPRYELPRYRDILSKVYNDLGEYHDRFSKINIKAEEFFLKAIETNPDYGKPYYNLANFALRNKVDYEGALKHYLEAEKNGFTNDTQNFNMGWLYYKKEDFYASYQKINKLLDKYPENSNLKFMIGTIFYKLNNFDLSEGMLLESYNYFETLRQMYFPLDMATKEGQIIATMLTKISNNLGATLQKKYEQTGNSKYVVWATKYYSDSIEFFAKTKSISDDVKKEETFQVDERIRYKSFDIENANQNLRMVLYPESGFTEPILYEDFTLDFKTTM